MDVMRTGDAKQEAANSAENHIAGASQTQPRASSHHLLKSLWASVIKIANASEIKLLQINRPS